MIVVNRSQIQKLIASNLVSAGVLNQYEADAYYDILSAMSMTDVLVALVESHQLREECSKPINFYPIGEISRN